MLGDDDLCKVLGAGAILELREAVVLGTVDEGNNIRILLNSTTLTKVGELGALGAALRLGRTVELRKGDDGDVEFLG